MNSTGDSPGHFQAVSALPDHTFELDSHKLREILTNPRIRKKKVAVISVAGAFRKGKSFLLDFFLRYLESECAKDWLGTNENEELQGFPWRSGSERHTTGILMWEKVFIIRTPDQGDVAVILLDTQGAFDSQSTVKDCATIFALSTMLSSVQIYNITNNIQEDNLQHLQLFTEYGRLALADDSNCTPFQRLLFLVRDWSYPFEYPYGISGGQQKLEKTLSSKDYESAQHEELLSVRRHIYSCFSQLDCCLLPHPGLNVATNPSFRGALKDISEEFRNHLNDFVPFVLSPDKLVVKKINGDQITCESLLNYFEAYMTVFAGDELPAPRTMLQATAEANNLSAVAAAKEVYTVSMDAVCGGDKPYIKPDILEAHHFQLRDRAVERFRSARKMGGEEFCKMYEDQLIKDLNEAFVGFVKNNESKNLFAIAKTPVALLAAFFVFYILSTLFTMMGFQSLAQMASLTMGVLLISVATWMYARVSGRYPEIGQAIDAVGEAIWDNAVGFVVNSILNSEMASQSPLLRSASMAQGVDLGSKKTN